MAGDRPLTEVLEESPPGLRVSRAGKTGAHALAGVGNQGKLRHQQQTTININQTQIHPAVKVGKYAISEQSLEQSIGIALLISGHDGNQGEDAALNPADQRESLLAADMGISRIKSFKHFNGLAVNPTDAQEDSLSPTGPTPGRFRCSVRAMALSF